MASNAHAFAHESVTRIYELAEEEGIRGPAALSRKLGQSIQSVHNWGRSPTGVSQKGAVKAQAIFGWSAEYILNGVGPKRIAPSFTELIGSPVEVPREMVKVARVSAILALWRDADAPSPLRGKVRLEPMQDVKHILVANGRVAAMIDAYEVGRGAFATHGRVREGDFIVVDKTLEPGNGDEVLVKRSSNGVEHVEMRTYVGGDGESHYFKVDHESDAQVMPVKDVAVEVIVAINMKASIIPVVPN
jgi:hypothetical protein